MSRSALALLALAALGGCSNEDPAALAPPPAGTSFDEAPTAPAEPTERPGLAAASSVPDAETVTFESLGGYPAPKMSDAGAELTIPEAVRQLDGKRIAIVGYLLPIELTGRKVTRFLVTDGSFGCCFVEAPAVNRYVDARTTPDGGLPVVPATACRLIGVLSVKEERDEYGCVTSVYRLAVDEIEILDGAW